MRIPKSRKLIRSLAAAWLLLALAGCSIAQLRMPEEFKEKKMQEDPPPDFGGNN